MGIEMISVAGGVEELSGLSISKNYTWNMQHFAYILLRLAHENVTYFWNTLKQCNAALKKCARVTA